MPLAAVLTRLIGLWILVGAVLKALYGSPADLPQVIQDLPLDLGLTFKLVVGLELVIGIVAQLRPSKGWLPALLLLLAFLVVLVFQVAGGEDSCGCFGTALVIAPAVMLAIDGTLTLLLVLSRPWRLQPGARELGWRPVVVVALLSLALPLLVDREWKPGSTNGSFKAWVEFKPEKLKGAKLADTPLHPFLSEDLRLIEDGLFVIWRPSCEVCADHLDRLAEEDGERDIVLMQLPPAEDEKSVIRLKPEGGYVFEVQLPDTVIWVDAPPVHIELKAGVVTKVLRGMEVYDDEPSDDGDEK